jgi:hypothetical protein
MTRKWWCGDRQEAYPIRRGYKVMSPRAFAIVLGVVMILGGLTLGAERFSASADGIPAQCVSVFDGGGTVSYDNRAVLDKDFSGQWHLDTPLVNACDAERNQYHLLTWLLVGAGVVLTAGGALVVRTKTEGK